MSYIGTPVLDQTFTLKTGEVAITGHLGVVLTAAPTNDDDLTIENPNASTPAAGYPIGIAQVDEGASIAADRPVNVRVFGISKAIAGTTFNAGVQLAFDKSGHVVTTAPSNGQWWAAVSLTKASAALDEVLVLLSAELQEA